MIDQIESYQQGFYEKYGLHFIHASDEWYITAERDFPEEERYDGYIQLENGVGMMRLLMTEFEEAMQECIRDADYPIKREKLTRTLTMATGKLTYTTIQGFADQIMEAFPGIHIHVKAIRNDFFGETITVSGLITGQDLIAQLKEEKEQGTDLGDTLIIPSNMLRMGEAVFLDDLTVSDVEQALNMKLVAVEQSGQELLEAILDTSYHMDRENDDDSFVYVQAFDH